MNFDGQTLALGHWNLRKHHFLGFLLGLTKNKKISKFAGFFGRSERSLSLAAPQGGRQLDFVIAALYLAGRPPPAFGRWRHGCLMLVGASSHFFCSTHPSPFCVHLSPFCTCFLFLSSAVPHPHSSAPTRALSSEPMMGMRQGFESLFEGVGDELALELIVGMC